MHVNLLLDFFFVSFGDFSKTIIIKRWVSIYLIHKLLLVHLWPLSGWQSPLIIWLYNHLFVTDILPYRNDRDYGFSEFILFTWIGIRQWIFELYRYFVFQHFTTIQITNSIKHWTAIGKCLFYELKKSNIQLSFAFLYLQLFYSTYNFS